MNITIVGAGRVGIYLAKYFSDEQQDVFLVDRNPEHLALLESDFNLRTFVGEPTDFKTLYDANSDHADVFVAVTANTAENLVACAMAKSMGARKTIARVDRYSYTEAANEQVLKKMGVDCIVFPDYLAAQSVIGMLDHPWSQGWSEFESGAIILVAVAVNEDSPICERYLRELYSESRLLHISALRRKGRMVIPRGDDCVKSGDMIFLTVVPEGIGRVMELTGARKTDVKRIILMGGSTVSELVEQLSAKKYSPVIIEKERERCRELMNACPDCDIICGDASELDVLEEAGIGKCDAFVALTDNTESNILSCLTSQELGVNLCIAEVEKEQLMAKAESFGIGLIINKPVITSNAIFRIILDSDYDSSKCFALKDAEAGKLMVKAGSFLTKSPVKELPLPEQLTLAGLIRDGKGYMVTGDTVIKEGDTVIFFCLPGALKKVEKLFGR